MIYPEKKVIGHKYKKTVGKILDYHAISTYLTNQILQDLKYDCIIDIPCGNGSLLNELAKFSNKKEFIGIDKSEEQIKLAHNDPLITYYIADIFRISELNEKINYTNCFCHIGFCFFNIFNEENRRRILTELHNCHFITTIGLEIQNTLFQSIFYKPDIWHESILKDGTVLMSNSKYIKPGKKKLLLKFIKNKKETIIEEELFDWDTENFKNDCIDSGWKKIVINSPDYREYRNNIPSHYFVLLKK